jgi:glycosyltransferase involved in cell wall biosynthesis
LRLAVPPSVSIVLPTFNRLKFLRPAIESVFAQTFEHWELVIADDGSEPETKTYLRSLLARQRVRVIWSAHTAKPSVVTNLAVRAARGEYVAFLDSDDVWHPRKLEIQIKSLHRHPERRWSYTRFALIDASGRPLKRAGARDWAAPSGLILEKLLREETVIAQPSVVVERELLTQLGAFDESLVMCYDDELWFRLAARAPIDGIDEPLTLVRRHDEHSGSDIIAWRDRRRVFEKALRTNVDERIDPLLRELRAKMSAGLARSQAASGKRLDAFGTLLSSVPHSWRYPRRWVIALAATAYACAPRPVRSLVRRLRYDSPPVSP